MGGLRGEKIVAVAPLKGLEEVAVHRRRAERRLVWLEGGREWLRHARMTCPEDDEEIRIRALQERPVGPAIRRPAPMEIDVRRDETGEPGARGAVARGTQPRALAMSEEAVYLAPEGIHLARVGAAGMGRRPAGTRQPVAFDPALAKGEAGAVQEARLVEALDDLRDVLGPRRLVAAPARQDVTHLGHGVLAVEEGDEIQKGNGEQRDLIGEAAGIPEPDQALAVLLHGKGLERAQSGPLHAFFHREPTARDTSELMPRKSLPPRRVPAPRRIRRPDAGSAGCRGRT